MNKKFEVKETDSSSAGTIDTATGDRIIKKSDITKIHNSKEYGVEKPNTPTVKKGEFKEATDSSSSGAYESVPFGPKKDPLRIDGVKSIGQSRAVKDKNFPKWGGPGGVFVKIKDKCKKFPYCNQGDTHSVETLREAIEISSKKYGLSYDDVEAIVLNEIKQIFI